MDASFFVSGWVLAEGDFEQGHVRVEGGRVTSVDAGPSPEPPAARGIVLPGLRNAHTHVGDAAVPPPPPGLGPGEVFTPPNGYKHRMLVETPEAQLRGGISCFLDAMTEHGTVEHVDFREGGVAGVDLIRGARADAYHPPSSRVFGRPAAFQVDPGELGALFGMVDGIGLSAVMDLPRSYMRDLVAAAHDTGLPVAFHCSESRREELSPVLDMGPAFLVHMVFGTPQDFRDLAAARVPVVACPRSTHRFTRAPPVADMARAGVELRLGTDNAMLQGPSVLDEVAFLLSLPENRELDPLEVLSWTLGRAKGSNTGGNIGVAVGSRDLAVMPFEGKDPTSFLRGDRPRRADLVMRDGRAWRR